MLIDSNFQFSSGFCHLQFALQRVHLSLVTVDFSLACSPISSNFASIIRFSLVSEEQDCHGIAAPLRSILLADFETDINATWSDRLAVIYIP